MLYNYICEYGCNSCAYHQLKNGKWCCSSRPSGCETLKAINGAGVKDSYDSGKHKSAKDVYADKSEESKTKMNWNKGNYSNTKFEYGATGSHKAVLLLERGHKCESCENTEWLGKPIPLELEHVDGDNQNNIKENLKLLCCNCHALTPTWRGRNYKGSRSKVVPEADLIVALQDSYSIRQALIKVGLVPKGGNYARCKKLLDNGIELKEENK